MNLRKLLFDDFDVNLPISGGMGNSIDNSIVIEKTGMNDYVGTEMAVLKYLGIGRRIEWKTIKQELLTHNSRQIDKIKIETKQTTDTQIITQIENFYFDITDCLKTIESEKSFDEEETLNAILNRIEILGNENDLNKKCVTLLKSGELLENYELSNKFCEVIFKDESLSLFKDMMYYKKKPILEVLRIIAPRL